MIAEDSIYNIFDKEGLLGTKLSNYEYREDQLLMSLDVLRTFETCSTCAIEAGTGIGKSFAYLAPSILSAFENPKERTVIATSTINLQRQIIDKDIPALFNVIGKSCSYAIAVGRSNYICKRRLYSEIENSSLLASDKTNPLYKLKHFADNSESGLKSELENFYDYSLWNDVCSDSDMCLGSKCPFFHECFYFKAKRKLFLSSIIICNHHLLLIDSHSRFEEDLSYDDECVLPPFKHLVIDEAHNLERNATELFSSEFSSYRLRHITDRIFNQKVSKARLLEELSGIVKNQDLYREITDNISILSQRADTLNLAVVGIMQYSKVRNILLTKENAGNILEDVKDIITDVVNCGFKLVSIINDFISFIPQDTDIAEVNAKIQDLSALNQRLSSLIDVLNIFKDPLKWNSDVHYIEQKDFVKTHYVVFCVSPIEVSQTLKDSLFSKVESSVCTSATLNLGDDFKYWSKGIGLPCPGKFFLKKNYASPFDYKNRLMLLTPYDSPDYTKENQESFASYLCTAIRDSVISAGGGALVLFTNKSLMLYCFEILNPFFSSNGLECMKQGDGDRYNLLENFKKKKDSILFATDSFWEGVDAPGETLRLVIITKLPFRMPDEPVFRAREIKIEKEGKSPFIELSLPDATMRLKQGFGRLMRHTTDRGIVLILDSRIVKKGYGALMLSSLPESYNPETSLKYINEKIERFLFG